MMRQLALDTETTGLSVEEGHRIIEVACVEIEGRSMTGKTFHQYVDPGRSIDAGAKQVHGITEAELQGKPKFADISEEFLLFIQDSELIIHNAPFDEGFLDDELQRLEQGKLRDRCTIIDTLTLAREKHPGGRNSLDGLCQRYQINNAHRDKHDALTDAHLLSQVYLAMTSGQVSLSLSSSNDIAEKQSDQKYKGISAKPMVKPALPILQASDEERARHYTVLKNMQQNNDTGHCIWLQHETTKSEQDQQETLFQKVAGSK